MYAIASDNESSETGIHSYLLVEILAAPETITVLSLPLENSLVQREAEIVAVWVENDSTSPFSFRGAVDPRSERRGDVKRAGTAAGCR